MACNSIERADKINFILRMAIRIKYLMPVSSIYTARFMSVITDIAKESHETL